MGSRREDIKREEKSAAAENTAIRVITIWPALMLAAKRKDRVTGRTETLVDSIRTRKGFNQVGAPEGRRWARSSAGAAVVADMIRLNQRTRPNDRVRSRWLVRPKT